MRPSWIRRWFMKQDDYTLWAYGVILLIVSISAAFWLIGLLLRILVHVS